MMLVIILEQIFLLYFDAGGRSLLIGDRLENCWLATSNSCIYVQVSNLSKLIFVSTSKNGIVLFECEIPFLDVETKINLDKFDTWT